MILPDLRLGIGRGPEDLLWDVKLWDVKYTRR